MTQLIAPIYLDNAATCGERPTEVVDAVVAAMRDVAANPGRSAHRKSLAAARLIDTGRGALAELINAPDPANVVFTKNATEALNLALFGLAVGTDDFPPLLASGATVLISRFEHNAVMRPLRALEARGNVVLESIPLAEDSLVDVEQLERRLGAGDVALVAVMAASNVSGQCAPLAHIGQACREHDVLFLVDAAQGAGVMTIDVQRQKVDLLALTGHKSLYGPQGTGVLYVGCPQRVAPLLHGGTGSRSEDEVQPEFCPDRFEAGTPNVAGIAGLAAGVRFVQSRGLDAIRAHHLRLRAALLAGLRSLPGVRVLGAGSGPHVGVVSVQVDGFSCSEIAYWLERAGVLIRSGLSCAPRAHRTLGSFDEGGATRFSVSHFTRYEDIEEALERTETVLAHLRSHRSRGGC